MLLLLCITAAVQAKYTDTDSWNTQNKDRIDWNPKAFKIKIIKFRDFSDISYDLYGDKGKVGSVRLYGSSKKHYRIRNCVAYAQNVHDDCQGKDTDSVDWSIQLTTLHLAMFCENKEAFRFSKTNTHRSCDIWSEDVNSLSFKEPKDLQYEFVRYGKESNSINTVFIIHENLCYLSSAYYVILAIKAVNSESRLLAMHKY